MFTTRIARPLVFAAAFAALSALPVQATTLVRQGIEGLTTDNETVLLGQVVETHSYWNADHSFIFTDVRVRPSQKLKGGNADPDVVVTTLGGTVGETTVLVIGTPLLVPGSEYVLFLNREDLPGGVQRLTVRDHVQGVFEVSKGRAVSQALKHPLLPDGAGRIDVPGGEEGLDVVELTTRVRELSGNR